jgi:nitronate monooxygenase
VPQVVDAVKVPVIAAGGISDARGIAAAFMLGTSGVQMGTAFLRCPESKISPLFRAALEEAGDASTVMANVYTGRPARGILNRFLREVGAMSDIAPAFRLAANAVIPLRAKAEAQGADDFSTMLAGQGAGLARTEPASELTQRLAADALRLLNASA